MRRMRDEFDNYDMPRTALRAKKLLEQDVAEEPDTVLDGSRQETQNVGDRTKSMRDRSIAYSPLKIPLHRTRTKCEIITFMRGIRITYDTNQQQIAG